MRCTGSLKTSKSASTEQSRYNEYEKDEECIPSLWHQTKAMPGLIVVLK
jgi:hypothetical protein